MKSNTQNHKNKNTNKRLSKIKSEKIRQRYVYDIHSRGYYLIKGIIISIIISLPIFLIIALSINTTDFPEEYMPPAILSTIFISIVIASIYSTATSKSKGWFNGTVIGFTYSLILVIIRWFLEERISFNKDIFTMLSCGLLLGSVCGIVGLNVGDVIRKNTRNSSKSIN